MRARKLERAPAEPRPQIAFATRGESAETGHVTILVNFGVFTGREATLAEVDRLAAALLERTEQVTIVSEAHHEIDRHSEAAVHQVRVEVPETGDADRDTELEHWLLYEAERWARGCFADRTGVTVA